jgi:hypothetical protein
MLNKTIVAALLVTLGAAAHVTAAGNRMLARFDGGIGVDPVSSLASPILISSATGQTWENVTRNFVRGVRSSFAIWRIADLKADVDRGGHIQVVGRGLVLDGGDQIGQSLGLKVFATLICEEQAPFVELNSADLTTEAFEGSVPLDPNGDFLIDRTLRSSSGDLVPSTCDNPVLLIRAANGAWLAAAIPRRDKD